MDRNIYVGFDIDETIIHSQQITNGIPHEDADFNIYHDDGSYAYSVYVRNNACLLLNYIDKHYNLFFYTRASKDYASKILINLGFENPVLFHSKHIDVERVETVYEGFKRFEVKRLDKIAKKMNCNQNDIIFFDDIKNNYEIRPLHLVVQVEPYIGNENDIEFSKLYNRFKEFLNNKYTAVQIRDILNNQKIKLKP